MLCVYLNNTHILTFISYIKVKTVSRLQKHFGPCCSNNILLGLFW